MHQVFKAGYQFAVMWCCGTNGAFGCVFRTIVTARFGIVTGDFGIVTGCFGDVTGGRIGPE